MNYNRAGRICSCEMDVQNYSRGGAVDLSAEVESAHVKGAFGMILDLFDCPN